MWAEYDLQLVGGMLIIAAVSFLAGAFSMWILLYPAITRKRRRYRTRIQDWEFEADTITEIEELFTIAGKFESGHFAPSEAHKRTEWPLNG